MSDLSNLPAGQVIGWEGRSKLSTSGDGVLDASNAAGTGFSRLKIAGGGNLLPYQTGSVAPDTGAFPTDGDWGLYRNTTTGIVNLCLNDGGTLLLVQTSDLYYNPLFYYEASDGADDALMFQRAMNAMATPTTGKALKLIIPQAIYNFSTTVQLPQTSDADIGKLRLCISGFGSLIRTGNLNGPAFARTSGTPTANSLLYTLEGLSLDGQMDFTAGPPNYGTIEPDLDSNPIGFTQNTTRTGFSLDKCDGLVMRECSVTRYETAVHIRGTKDFALDRCALNAPCCLYLGKTADNTTCSRGVAHQLRLAGGRPFASSVVLEEADGIKFSRPIAEQGSPKSVFYWKCNDNTTCRRLLIEDMYDENSAKFGTLTVTNDSLAFVQNKTPDAVVKIDGVNFMPYTAVIRYYPEDDSALTVITENIHIPADNTYGPTAVTSQEPNGIYNFGASDPNDNYVRMWESDIQWSSGEAVFHPMPIATSASETTQLAHYAAIADPPLGEEPAPHYTPQLSGGTADYYPVGTKVYLAGQYFESRVASPSTAPQASTTTADWEYIGPASWMPLGLQSAYATAPNSHANAICNNPRATGTDALAVLARNCNRIPPVVSGSTAYFDNFGVPTSYMAEGWEVSGYFAHAQWWQVINGTQTTGF